MRNGDTLGIWIQKTLRRDSSGAMRRDDARNLLRRTMEAMIERHGFTVYAWAMLPSKVELVLAMPKNIPVQQIVGDTFCYFTRRFNARYSRTGPLFRTKFLKRHLATTDAIVRTIREVNLAPVKRDLARKAGQEPYSSLDAYATGRPDGIVTLHPGVAETIPPLYVPGPTWASAV